MKRHCYFCRKPLPLERRAEMYCGVRCQKLHREMGTAAAGGAGTNGAEAAPPPSFPRAARRDGTRNARPGWKSCDQNKKQHGTVEKRGERSPPGKPGGGPAPRNPPGSVFR